MNKYKEAKAWLDKINANPHWNRVDIEEPALSQLNELFEKATPKGAWLDVGERYTIENHGGRWAYINNDIYAIFTCPQCEESVFADETKFKFCPCCGHRIGSEDDG